MSSDYQRYMIAWIPQVGSPLAKFGKDWTGWCADDLDTAPAWPRDNRLGLSGQRWEIALRGLHATLSRPFKLAPGRSRWRLDDALSAAAKTIPALAVPGFELQVVDGQVVLVPRHFLDAIERLQDRVADVVHLVATRPGHKTKDPTGLGPIPAGLGSGAPAIPRFVVPLTDRIDGSGARDVAAMLRPRIAGLISPVHMLDDLALLGDTGRRRRWRLLERYRLAERSLENVEKGPEPLQCPDARELPLLEAVMGSDWDTVIA